MNAAYSVHLSLLLSKMLLDLSIETICKNLFSGSVKDFSQNGLQALA